MNGKVRVVLVTVVSLFCTAALAKDDDRQERIRRLSQDRKDPHCASEGPGFIYEPNTATCLRIGGAVGVEAGRGNLNNLLGR